MHCLYLLSIVALALLFTLTVALPATSPVKAAIKDEDEIVVIRQSLNKTADGGYVREVVLSNGASEKETARLVTIDGVDEDGEPVKRVVLVKEGEYQIIDDETGQPLTIKYRADQNGYRAEGDHLPQPPKVPGEEDDYEDRK